MTFTILNEIHFVVKYLQFFEMNLMLGQPVPFFATHSIFHFSIFNLQFSNFVWFQCRLVLHLNISKYSCMSCRTTETKKWWNSSGFGSTNGLPHISFIVIARFVQLQSNTEPKENSFTIKAPQHEMSQIQYSLWRVMVLLLQFLLLCLCSFLTVTSCTWCITLLHLKCSTQERWEQNKNNDNIQSEKHHFPVQMLSYLLSCLAWCMVYDARWMAHFLKCFFLGAVCIAHVNKCNFFHFKHFHIRILFEMFALSLLRFVFGRIFGVRC